MSGLNLLHQRMKVVYQYQCIKAIY